MFEYRIVVGWFGWLVVADNNTACLKKPPNSTKVDVDIHVVQVEVGYAGTKGDTAAG